MTASVRSGGVTHTLPTISFRDGDGTLRPVAVGMLRNAANALKLFFGSLSAPLDKSSVFGKTNTSASVAITTQAVTVTPDGGAAPYHYAWSMTGSSGVTWSATAPTSATTSFTGGNLGPGDSYNSTWHCVVTDAVGNTVTTGLVTATVSNIGYNISGGGGPLP